MGPLARPSCQSMLPGMGPGPHRHAPRRAAPSSRAPAWGAKTSAAEWARQNTAAQQSIRCRHRTTRTSRSIVMRARLARSAPRTRRSRRSRSRSRLLLPAAARPPYLHYWAAAAGGTKSTRTIGATRPTSTESSASPASASSSASRYSQTRKTSPRAMGRWQRPLGTATSPRSGRARPSGQTGCSAWRSATAPPRGPPASRRSSLRSARHHRVHSPSPAFAHRYAR